MRLFIRIRPARQAADRSANQTTDAMPCEWVVRSDRGQTLARGASDAGDLGEIIGASGVPDVESALADPDNIVILVPGAEVAWLSCLVPGRRAAQIRRALPFAVEEFLTQDVESMHLAHGSIVRGRPVRCALIDRQAMADWLDWLRDCGLRPGHMAADASLLPCDEVSASVLLEGGEALVRTPEHIASMETSSLPDVLRAVRASFGESDDSLALQLIGAGELSQTQAATANSGFDVHKMPIDGTPLEFLAARWEANRPEINLLQGQFAPARRGDASPRGWRSVAALAALLVIAALAVLIAEGHLANHRADLLEAESVDLYRSIYPNERRVPNAYAQMRQKLRRADTGQGAFHLLVGQLAAGTSQGQINVRSITFNDSRGELTSELWLPGYAEIDALKRELERQGLTVDINSAEERDDVVRARLRIRLRG